MKSALHGAATSAAEVTSITDRGFRLRLDGEDLFVPFAQFPWFRDSAPEALRNIERPQSHHLRWPDLDVDLVVDSIRHPERYPLVSRG
jgi:hypothetical protein